MKQKGNIIRAVLQQGEVLARIAKECFTDPWTETIFRETLQQPHSQIWCVKEQQVICGYLAISRMGEEISVDDIAVLPQYRRKGYGRALLEFIHEVYPNADFWLEVRQSNNAAIALYTGLGYVKVGLRKRYYQNPSESAVLMTRYAAKCNKD